MDETTKERSSIKKIIPICASIRTMRFDPEFQAYKKQLRLEKIPIG